MEISNPFRQCLASSVNVRRNQPGFGNQPRQLKVTCGEGKERDKERRKLVKGLEKDLGSFAAMRFGIDPKSGLAGGVQESLLMEAAEVLMRQLRCVREDEAETKWRRKQEKKNHKTNSMGMQEYESTKDSGDFLIQNPTDLYGIDGISSNAAEAVARVLLQSREDCNEQDKQRCHLTFPATTEVSVSEKLFEAKKVEICMGGKCRNSGGSQLLEQIQCLVAKEGNVSVVGCKCLGMCKTSPNVKLSSVNAATAVVSGVSISDVDSLMAGFLELK